MMGKDSGKAFEDAGREWLRLSQWDQEKIWRKMEVPRPKAKGRSSGHESIRKTENCCHLEGIS